MEVALKLGLPIIGVNLNGKRTRTDLCPPAIRDELAVYIPFQLKIMEHAMDNWPQSHKSYRAKGDSSHYYFSDSIYKRLGL